MRKTLRLSLAVLLLAGIVVGALKPNTGVISSEQLPLVLKHNSNSSNEDTIIILLSTTPLDVVPLLLLEGVVIVTAYYM